MKSISKKIFLFFIIVTILLFSCIETIPLNNEPRLDDMNFIPKSSSSSLVYEWDALWDGEGGYGIAIDSLDNTIMVGRTDKDSNGDEDILILKYNKTGNLLWNKTWDNANSESAADVEIDYSNNIFVLGNSGNQMYLIKFNHLGNQVWNSSWGSATGTTLTVDITGFIYCTGYKSIEANYDAFIVKFDLSGNEIWSTYWGGSLGEDSWGIKIDDSYNLYIIGGTRSYGYYQIFIAKFDALGNFIWNRFWGGGDYENAWALDLDSDGNIYIAGESWSYHPGIYTILLKYSPSGNLLWNQSWGIGLISKGRGIGVDSLDNIYVTSNEGNTVHLLKYDINGNFEWDKEWRAGVYTTTANEVGIDSEDNVYIVGTYESPNDHLSLVKFGIDTDGDGLTDFSELNVYFTNPLITDTDSDGLDDYEEVYGSENVNFGNQPTNPNGPDSDNDGLDDYEEINGSENVNYGNQPTDPNEPDSDNDGVDDSQEINIYNTNPLSSDTDLDDLEDGEEINIHNTNPLNSDTDSDGLPDGLEVNFHNTNPLSGDTDSDTMPDKWEIVNALNPLMDDTMLDPDSDDLSNILEHQHNTDPQNPDTDLDGWTDGDEVLVYNTDPLDPFDHPSPPVTIPGYYVLIILIAATVLILLFLRKNQITFLEKQ